MSNYQLEKRYVIHDNNSGESITVREDLDGLGMTEIVYTFKGAETIIELHNIEQLECLKDAIMQRIQDIRNDTE